MPAAQPSRKFTLKAFVEELRADIAHNRIKLPTLPNISLEALVVVNDDTSTVADVAEVVERDTAIAARLVKYANSPLYRGVKPVTTIKAAITRIGFDKVRHAILTLAMKEVFKTGFKPLQQRMEELWEHSMDVATRAALLARDIEHIDQEEALLAGLVHDIGAIPILLKAQDYEVLVNSRDNLNKLIAPIHAAIGRDMLKVWKFDPRMVAVAAEHENLNRDPGNAPVDLVDLVIVANVLSHADTDHPLARVNYRDIPAFRRVNWQPPPPEDGPEQEEETMEDIEELRDLLI